MYFAVTSELVRLNTENSHLQTEKQSFVETTEKLSEKAASLVSHAQQQCTVKSYLNVIKVESFFELCKGFYMLFEL